jgi:hypothetical protein
MDKTFSHLGNLIGAYLNQDYEYFGDTVEAVLASYCEENTAEDVAGLGKDAVEFMARYADSLDEEFAERYRFDFDPKLWKMDARAFLLMVAQVTAEHGAGGRGT